MAVFLFSDTAEFGIVRKDKKNPPFRRKPESPRRRREISRRFAAAEILAFAGMENLIIKYFFSKLAPDIYRWQRGQ
ncbi:MAG: hypothetical protein ACR2QC_04750 [Gammaproteobacteria bacterium]